jgi:hypothetical protein
MLPPQSSFFWASSFGIPSDFVIRILSFVWHIRHDGCNDKDVHQGDFEKEKPA